MSAGFDLSVVRQWAEAVVTRGNTRFAGTLARSRLANAHYLLVLLPFGILVAVTAAAGSLGRWAVGDDDERRRLRMLCLAGLLGFVLAFPLSMTGYVARVVRAQFPGWVVLLAVAARVRPRGRVVAAVLPVLPALGVATLAFTVWHSGLEATSAPPPTTQAVLRLIEGLPDHANARIFVTESNLRRLLPFVEFRSFVNHFHGRYYSQDLASANAMYDAYVHIRDRSGPWADDLARYDVRLLAFRQGGEGEAEREAGSRYLGDGRAVLANPEWWVLAPPAADRR